MAQMGAVNSGQPHFSAMEDGAYGLLRKLPPGLCVDCGAAAGVTVGRILKHSPNSRVIAFEPFPGNWPRFEEAWGSDSRCELRKIALGASATIAPFYVAHSATLGGHAGASNVGTLVGRGDLQ